MGKGSFFGEISIYPSTYLFQYGCLKPTNKIWVRDDFVGYRKYLSIFGFYIYGYLKAHKQDMDKR